jgi:hypothetical protein
MLHFELCQHVAIAMGPTQTKVCARGLRPGRIMSDGTSGAASNGVSSNASVRNPAGSCLMQRTNFSHIVLPVVGAFTILSVSFTPTKENPKYVTVSFWSFLLEIKMFAPFLDSAFSRSRSRSLHIVLMAPVDQQAPF